jgi:hypothetical protein
MLELCKRSNRDLVVAYVTGAMERANKDMDFVQSALADAIENKTSEIDGLKDIWKSRQYCAPAGDVAIQAADNFCAYLLLNPQKRKMASIDLLEIALREVWPCVAASSVSKQGTKSKK